jgi:hypothetical protein
MRKEERRIDCERDVSVYAETGSGQRSSHAAIPLLHSFFFSFAAHSIVRSGRALLKNLCPSLVLFHTCFP